MNIQKEPEGLADGLDANGRGEKESKITHVFGLSNQVKRRLVRKSSKRENQELCFRHVKLQIPIIHLE